MLMAFFNQARVSKAKQSLIAAAKAAYRLAGWLLLACLVSLALTLSVARYFVGTLDAQQGRIETWLHQQGLSYLQLGELSGSWHGFDPTVNLSGLHIEVDGNTVLAIDELALRLDSLRSLWHGSPVLSEARLAGVRFALDKIDGEFTLRGFPIRGSFDIARYLVNTLSYIKAFSAEGVAIEVNNEGLPVHIGTGDGQVWSIHRWGGRRQVSIFAELATASASGTAEVSKVEVYGHYQGALLDHGALLGDDFTAELFVDVPSLGLEKLFPEIGQDTRLASASLAAKLWLKAGPAAVDVTAALNLADVTLRTGEGEVTLLTKGQALARYQGASLVKGSVHLPALWVSAGEANLSAGGLSLAWSATDASHLGEVSLAGELPGVDVGQAFKLVDAWAAAGLLPKSVRRALSQISPRGLVTELLFSSRLDGTGARLVGGVEDVQTDPYLGIPSFSSVNGLISLTPTRGHLDIHNDDFVMAFADIFQQPWHFSSARGRIGYEQLAGRYVIDSSLIELIQGGEAKGYGKLMINLPPQSEQQTWGLLLGITQVDLRDAERYLPQALSPEVQDWLKMGIKQGRALEAGLLFHGALHRDSPGVSKKYAGYFEVEDATLLYDEDWPVLEQLGATVYLSSEEVAVSSSAGRLYNSGLVTANVSVPIIEDAATTEIFVTAESEGPVSDGLRLLKETPLATYTSDLARDWSGEGAMKARFSLEIPLGQGDTPEVGARVNVRVKDATLAMADLELTLEALEGDIAYSDAEGVTANGLHGQLFGQPISGTITTSLEQPSLGSIGGKVVIHAVGFVEMPNLYQWADLSLLSRASGLAGYDAYITVPYGETEGDTVVEATSTLKGVTLDLPPPLAKPDPNSMTQFHYRHSFNEDIALIDLSWDQVATASLKLVDGIPTGGLVHLGQTPPGDIAYDAIRVTGQPAYMNYEDWMTTREELSKISDSSLVDELNRAMDTVTLQVASLDVFDLLLADADVLGTREADGWRAEIKSEGLEGRFQVPDAPEAPVVADLKHLRYVSDEETGDQDEEFDPLAGTQPLTFSDMDVAIESFFVDDEDYGQWSFQFRVRDEVAVLDNLRAESLGLSIGEDSFVEWWEEEGQQKTRFKGSLGVPDLGVALQHFGFASSVEGQDIAMMADVSWEGSPAMVELTRITGTVQLLEGEGRFVQAKTSGAALKILGIFNFAQLARRFRLDFSDVVKKGHEFNRISGKVSFSNGSVEVAEPVMIQSPASIFTLGGKVDLISGELDNDLVVTLPLNRALPWYAAYSAIVTGPLAGLGVVIAQRLFKKQIQAISSAKYYIGGTWDEPDIKFDSIFNASVRADGDTKAETKSDSQTQAEAESPDP